MSSGFSEWVSARIVLADRKGGVISIENSTSGGVRDLSRFFLDWF